MKRSLLIGLVLFLSSAVSAETALSGYLTDKISKNSLRALTLLTDSIDTDNTTDGSWQPGASEVTFFILGNIKIGQDDDNESETSETKAIQQKNKH